MNFKGIISGALAFLTALAVVATPIGECIPALKNGSSLSASASYYYSDTVTSPTDSRVAQMLELMNKQSGLEQSAFDDKSVPDMIDYFLYTSDYRVFDGENIDCRFCNDCYDNGTYDPTFSDGNPEYDQYVAAAGCLAYAKWIRQNIYGQAYDDDFVNIFTSTSQVDADILKDTLKKYGQAGETLHIASYNPHTVVFVSCDDEGMYYMDWAGSPEYPAMLHWATYEHFCETLKEYYLYELSLGNMNKAENDVKPGKTADHYRLTYPGGTHTVRASASASSELVGTLNTNEIVCVTKYNSNKRWGYISKNGISGWIRLFYVKKTGSKHTFGDWEVTSVPTCTKDGSRTRCCECGAKQSEVISATGHSYTEKTVPPTYSNRGYTLYTCTICGESYKDDYVPRLTLENVSDFKIGGRTDSVVRLSWSKNNNATGYIIQQYINDRWVRIAKITDRSKTAFLVKGLEASTRYAFRIQSYREISGGAVKSEYTPKLIAYTNPKPVSDFKVIGRTDKAVTLSWNRDSKATGYIIQQYKNNKWVRIAKINNNKKTTYAVSGQPASQRCAFRIQSYKSVGDGAVKSEFTDKLVTYTNPTAVTGFYAADRFNSAIRLSWDKNSSATGYIIQQYVGNKWVRIAKIANNKTTSFTVTGLGKKTRYAFRIQAYKNVPNGAVKSVYTDKLVVYTK